MGSKEKLPAAGAPATTTPAGVPSHIQLATYVLPSVQTARVAVLPLLLLPGAKARAAAALQLLVKQTATLAGVHDKDPTVLRDG